MLTGIDPFYRRMTSGGWLVFTWLVFLGFMGAGAYGLYFCWTVDAPPEYAPALLRIRTASWACVAAGMLGVAAWVWLRRRR